MAANGGRRGRPSKDELYLQELRLLRRSIDNFSANVGKWLSAVALAAANPADNTAEVQKQIDQLTADINASSDEVEAELNESKPKES